MIIWGSKYREVDIGKGSFDCPECATQRGYRKVKGSRYFTLYFIPLFPTETLGIYVRCDQCKSNYTEQVLQYRLPTEEEKQIAMARHDLLSGTPVQMAMRKLQNQGIEEAHARSTVEQALGENSMQCLPCGLQFIAGVSHCSSCGTAL